MERLEKLINILKLTPHRQPELVKEASHRILSRSIRTDDNSQHLLKPLIEILIQYCDNDDSAQRSLFNDYLNSVILAFQQRSYQIILKVLLDEITTNGSARTVTAALQRIPHLIRNVKPVELGCEHQKLLKALIEVSRRAEDESVLKALDSVLECVMPYLDHHIKKSREMQLLASSLIDVLIRNLQDESSQTKRLASTSLSHISKSSEHNLSIILTKLETQLDSLKNESSSTNKFIGFCLCVKEIPELLESKHEDILQMVLKYVNSTDKQEISLRNSALETLRELFKFNVDPKLIDSSAELIARTFLINEVNGVKLIKEETKVTLQANALACIGVLIKQRPVILNQLDALFLFQNHSDVAVRNQLINIIGIYIEASWRFPFCTDQSINCEKTRKLWVELRSILNDPNAHPDTLKTCVIATKTCVNTLLESDHCLHIIEYCDFYNLIQLYSKSNFKPFKVEVLGLFATLNYRTLYYLERSHWSKMKSQTACALTDSLQNQILSKVIVASLIDEHPRIRSAATSAIVAMIPNLYILNMNIGQKNIFYRSIDPIVSLAQDLADEHLVVLKQADEHINHFSYGDEPVLSSEPHEILCIKQEHRLLSSSIVQLYDNPHNEQPKNHIDVTKSQHRMNIIINLNYVVTLLKNSIENSLEKGKNAISAIVSTLYELSLVYPVYQYSISWDCRPSEYCECCTLLNFLLTYLENLNEPDVIVEDLEAYKNFLSLSHQLLYALCHECVLNEYENQKMKPIHKRKASTRDGEWSELTLKPPCIADTLDIYLEHLKKLLWLLSYIIEERSNLFSSSLKQSSSQQQKTQFPESIVSHGVLVSNRLFFGRVHKKLESSFKSSKKNLNQHDEKFYQILETCLMSIASLLEFVPMNKSIECVKELLGYIEIVSPTCSVNSLICARQLLKSLFGINILALYQVDPIDWFEDESWSTSPTNLMSKNEISNATLHGVYHHLISNPYKIFSSYNSMHSSQITPTSDKALAMLNFESCRALKVRRRIEARVKSLFVYNPHQLITPKVRQISELLKNTITEFTPIVNVCMKQFHVKGFIQYQSEILHFMSYLMLLRVNYQKLAMAEDLVNSVHKLLDQCGEKVYTFRRTGLENFLRNSFTFLILLSYERGPSKPMFQVAVVIQKLDDVRAKLCMTNTCAGDIATYIVPLLRCLVEDLFIYRTVHFQRISNNSEFPEKSPAIDSKKDTFEVLEAERETVAQKLIDVIDDPRVYDLLSILILESRQNTSEIKYKKLSQHLLSIIPKMLSDRTVNLVDYNCIELTRRIIENISPEVFQPVNFIIETLIQTPKPSSGNSAELRQEFRRWMSLVIIAMHILITQVQEEVFLARLREDMSESDFVEYLLHIAQLSIAEIMIQFHSPIDGNAKSNILFLVQQISSYILYLTHMFQSGMFFQLSRTAVDIIRREVQNESESRKSFLKLSLWARDPSTGFSLHACEQMFYQIRLVYPNLTIFWCNLMMLLNNVDCNRDFWRKLLVYDCQHCQNSNILDDFNLTLVEESSEKLIVEEEGRFIRSNHINRPSSLNLSDISFNDQLRRSFIKKIASSETREKAFNRNIIETNGEDGQLLEREVTIGNTEQCLSPNIELTRRGALCAVLDFVTISMNDVEHITWLIIHHINDIIRWSHETPITEFINSVHGNSASSGIFIQAINSGFNDLTSISLVTRLLWTLEQVHYTQYGSLVVLLVEKLLSSKQLAPYRSLTKNIEEFACNTVKKLLNETNKSLVTTNDEVVNQLTAEDLDRIYALLDVDLYPNLSKLLLQLRESTPTETDTPTIELHTVDNLTDDDSETDELEVLYSKANLVFWLTEQNSTGNISSLIFALNTIKTYLSKPSIVERVNKDEVLVCFLVSTFYSLALTILPPPTRLSKPKFWTDPDEVCEQTFFKGGDTPALSGKPLMLIESKRKVIKPLPNHITLRDRNELSKKEKTEEVRMACLKGLFLLENIDYLQINQYEYIGEVILRLARLPLINSFLLTPPNLWRQNIWPKNFDSTDTYMTAFPIVPHHILSKDHSLLENFCDRLLKLGWISRRQFEEAWMTLLGVLSASLSEPDETKEIGYGTHDVEKKTNLLSSCKVVSTITKLLLLTRRRIVGNPLEADLETVQSFEEKVIGLTKSIATNLSSLRKRTKGLFDSLDLDRKPKSADVTNSTSSMFRMSLNQENQQSGFSHFLKVSAQKLRMNAILNVEMDLQETVVIENEQDNRFGEVDTESCVRLLLSIYKQKLKDPNENLVSPARNEQTTSQVEQKSRKSTAKNKPNQLAPPLATSICQSILALSDMFTDYEEFDWMFETFVQMFRLAEHNEDGIQMQFLILGLCKSTSVCYYEIPNELATTIAVVHREVMFEKCRQSIEKCLRCNFGPLKLNALLGAYYMLEDSINIVASGAWELDHFKQLRTSRLNWILKLMPVILDKENSKLLTKNPQVLKLLECLCDTVTESELKSMKS